MGKKIGRPRKNPKVSYFFEFRGKARRKAAKSKDQKELAFNNLRPSTSRNQEMVPFINKDEPEYKNKQALVTQIVEAWELMGLISPSETEEAANIIANNLSD